MAKDSKCRIMDGRDKDNHNSSSNNHNPSMDSSSSKDGLIWVWREWGWDMPRVIKPVSYGVGVKVLFLSEGTVLE